MACFMFQLNDSDVSRASIVSIFYRTVNYIFLYLKFLKVIKGRMMGWCCRGGVVGKG